MIDIGTRFMSRGNHPKECIVIERYTTTDSKGNVVKVSYAAVHKLCGQNVTERDIPESTIVRGMING